MTNSTLAVATARLGALTGETPQAEGFRALGIAVRLVIDDSAHVVSLPPERSEAPDVTVALSSSDIVALADGDLGVVQALTQGRLAAQGPIFAAIGFAHVLTTL
ncbi:SCP2 sterol-binding domain-containing protein [Rhodococcus qingshengii]